MKTIKAFLASSDELKAERNEFSLKASTVMSDLRINIQERSTQACQAYEEALTLAREVWPEGEKLARIILYYSHFVLQFDENEKCQTLSKESLPIYRKLAAANPEKYLPNLAVMLNNSAVSRKKLNDNGDSIINISNLAGAKTLSNKLK